MMFLPPYQPGKTLNFFFYCLDLIIVYFFMFIEKDIPVHQMSDGVLQ